MHEICWFFMWECVLLQFSGDKVQYPEHLPLSVIQKGLKTGKYLQGKFMASRENYTEANVSVADQEKMVRP